MSRTLRIALIAVGVFVVLLLIAPFLIPVNQFRPTIEREASEALGRKVQVGNLSLSLLSGSLSAENLSIGDDTKFSSSPFLTAKSLNVGVDLLPLILSRTLNVTGITIENPEVTLLRNAAGQWNYSSLGGSAAKARTKSKSAGSTNSVPDLTIKKLELKDGRITVGSTSSRKRSTYDHVSLVASDFSMTSKFPVTLTAQLPDGGKLKLDGKVGPIDEADAALTPLDAKLNVSSLNLASTGFLDPSLGLGGLLDLDATVGSHNGEAETKGDAKLSKALLVAGGSPATVPVNVNFNTKYNLHKNAGVLNPSTLKIGNAAAYLSGTYQTPADETIVNVKIEGENMPARDLEAFLPALGIHLPKGASLAAGTLNTNLNVTGPTNKLVTNGTVGLFKAKIANFDLGSKMSTINMLTGVKTGQDLDIEKLTTNLRMATNGLQADNFLAVVPALGNLTGAGTVDSKNNLDFKMAATLANAATFSSSAGAPVSGIGGILGAIGGGKGGCKGATIPFQIHGTTADPKFVPDVGGIAASMFQSQLGCVGGTASGKSQQQNPNNPIDALSGLFKKKP
ncbi:MAG TPA: AsmA family protein [Candidatus Acidoferrum sp.]|nr:AsmA family protein [Candidatus Acidoferrum sp.]